VASCREEEAVLKVIEILMREGVAELIHASVIHRINLGSNFGVDKIFSDSVCLGFPKNWQMARSITFYFLEKFKI
jgi:hypothetical protein